MSDCWDVGIIGGGPAGYTAALYAARAGFSVLLLEKLAPGGQMATTDVIDNYPGFPEGVSGFDLADHMKRSAERFGAVTRLAEVQSVGLAGPVKEIVTRKETLRARAVVLATGASPRELGLPGERELRGGMFFRGQSVCVVGCGNTAVADALYLSRLCARVTLIHRRDRLRASAVYAHALESAPNLEILWNTTVTSLEHDDVLTGVGLTRTDTGATRTLPCAALFVVGHVPESGLFRGQVDLDPAGYVLADETTRTRLPGVFAVGDLRQKPLRQVVTAAADGAVAAHFIEEYLGA